MDPAMNNLQCDLMEETGGLVLKLVGQITFAEMDEFEKQLARVAARKPARLVLDLTDLTMITSAGIGALLKLHRRAVEQKCDLRLAALQHDIEDVFRKARLDSIFSIVPTLNDALVN